jgi:hypothetical protein
MTDISQETSIHDDLGAVYDVMLRTDLSCAIARELNRTADK